MAKSKPTLAEQPLAQQIRASEESRLPVETMLATDERVLARITDGIYRQPSSALRELISNAYDADATEVVILTDAPRFAQISIRDNGLGLSPEVLEHLVKHIGGSVKRSEEGQELGVTAKNDQNRSPSGRQLIGKLGIGLFSVAQFTRHFLIITKTKEDAHRTIADITLGSVGGQQKLLPLKDGGPHEIETGHARIWRERAAEKHAHGTEVKLLDLLPRTRAELASDDLWAKIDFEKEDDEAEKTKPPTWHIGRMKPKQNELLEAQSKLPWEETDEPDERFQKLVSAVRDAAVETESVDLDIFFDRYLQTIWTLSLSAPLEYLEGHPFDLAADDEFRFFELENRARGQAKPLNLKKSQTPRSALRLKTPDGASGERFDVFIDGIKLFRPILYRNLPKTKTAVTNPLMFVGHDLQKFEKKHVELSGGPLMFEAYLFWSPRIIPKQHQGVVIRVGNAAGALFDRTFMGYQVSEQTRTRQITAEIFVREGLDGAINIDRESFNYAHPHYQYLVKWLHSALRQLANRHKEIGSGVRSKRLVAEGKKVREKVEEKVESALKARGVEDIPEVVLLDVAKQSEAKKLRNEGTIALRKAAVLPPSPASRSTSAEGERRKLAEKKAIAVVQLLHGWGLLEKLSFDEQEKLVRDILEIVLLEN
jgi:Histidine kinase-, DNA gyrase B-, and HSP90-like ATPase